MDQGARTIAAASWLLVLSCLVPGTSVADDTPTAEAPACDDCAFNRPRNGGLPLLVEPPFRRLHIARDGSATNVLVPVVELPIINIAHWGLLKILDKPYANINLDTMWSNISDWHWIWDNDNYLANGLGHPYQGAWVFSAARSSGLDFWTSIPFPLVASAFWELFMENEDPSVNDMIVTPLGGIFLGEFLHRAGLLMLDEGAPTFVRWLGATIIDPMGSLNLLLFGRRADSFFAHPPWFARLELGAGTTLQSYTRLNGVRVDDTPMQQVFGGIELIYGLPGDERWSPSSPFDHMVFQARGAVSRDPNIEIYLRGLVAGWRIRTEGLRGIAGVYAGFDYTNLGTLRVTTPSIGFGGAAQLQASQTVAVLPTLVLSGVPYGAGGQRLPQVDQRAYHAGPGAQALLSVQAVVADVARFSVDARLYYLSGAFRDEGFELIGDYRFFAEVAVADHHGVGVELVSLNRSAAVFGTAFDTTQHLASANVYWTLLSDGTFGAFTPARPPQ